MGLDTEQGTPARAVCDAPASVSRRGFLEGATSSAMLATALASSGQVSAAVARSTEGAPTASLLPDGSEFPRWEQPLEFSRTYYVNNGASNANDNGPGDRTRPFKTIGKAAEVLMPGERVVIAEGIYRECVRPARGGSSPAQMISYEAAPGAKVYIKGSEVLTGEWKEETVRPGFGRPAATAPGTTVWRYDLPGTLFPDAYNPFALPSIMGSWGWLDGATVDMGPYLRRRGLVFVNGKPLEPMEQRNELAMPKLPPVPDYTRPPAPMNGLPPVKARL